MFRKLKRWHYNLTHPVIGEVWQLHHVTDFVNPDLSLRDYEISPSKLEQLILKYRRKGYEFISVESIGKPRAHKFVAVTLDDGYEDNFSVALPLFRKYDIPFCIFVAVDYVFNDEVRARHGGMTPQQLSEISTDPLCTIGAHTVSHCRLSFLSLQEQRREMEESKRRLESFLGKPVTTFAYPYGDYSSETANLASGIFEMAFAAWGGGVRIGFGVFNVPRIIVY